MTSQRSHVKTILFSAFSDVFCAGHGQVLSLWKSCTHSCHWMLYDSVITIKSVVAYLFHKNNQLQHLLQILCELLSVSSLTLYRLGHLLWWRVWHVTVWGVLSRTRGQERDEWFRSEHSRRLMEVACRNEQSRLSPGLYDIDVLDNGRSGGQTSPIGAHRRIFQET